jgi:hypothetical protein
MPLAILLETIFLDETIFFCRRWLVLAPVVTLVDHDVAFAYQILGVFEATPVKFD